MRKTNGKLLFEYVLFLLRLLLVPLTACGKNIVATSLAANVSFQFLTAAKYTHSATFIEKPKYMYVFVCLLRFAVDCQMLLVLLALDVLLVQLV